LVAFFADLPAKMAAQPSAYVLVLPTLMTDM
jgi:hypothetical protein